MAKKQATKSKLKREVKLPVKGTLSKKVSMPKWIRAIGSYFKGSWKELREVHWPTRKTTWGLTLAVLIFTVLVAGLILALDFGFEQLFKGIIL